MLKKTVSNITTLTNALDSVNNKDNKEEYQIAIHSVDYQDVIKKLSEISKDEISRQLKEFPVDDLIHEINDIRSSFPILLEALKEFKNENNFLKEDLKQKSKELIDTRE